ncbi:uncharacterized protein LOC121314224 isoform X2 [Polyodon spathula]|nr:uncharacterized protein LOC121314224 isoform X2 [Polyodon spathula]XP_041103187.1 uncharacterized protein LOC121314224 isoform X2 [Polyodon spathula]XP_041103188.1 uncharacterized protein LOC121314224 isoform X2 [Polyodon spathula]
MGLIVWIFDWMGFIGHFMWEAGHYCLNVFILVSILTLLTGYLYTHIRENNSDGQMGVTSPPEHQINSPTESDYSTACEKKTQRDSVTFKETLAIAVTNCPDGGDAVRRMKVVELSVQDKDSGPLNRRNQSNTSRASDQPFISADEDLYCDLDDIELDSNLYHQPSLYTDDGYPECFLENLKKDTSFELRKIVFKVMVTGRELPCWINTEETLQLPNKLFQEGYAWINQWNFEYRSGGNPVEKLQASLDVFLKKWALICNVEPQHARERVCEIMLKSEEMEERICEAVKFLMLCKAIQMYNRMGDGEDVPVFCTVLFARSTSRHPYHFMINHLNILGLDSRLKQMEVELLLYTLFS